MIKTLSPSTDFSSSLRARNLKVTPARVAVLTVLSSSKQPLTVEEILERLGEGTTDQATVYRMMNSFQAKGLVRQVDFEHGHAHYELAGDREHHHLVCVSCGRVEDVEGCPIEKYYGGVLKKLPAFSQIYRHTLELFGLCHCCEKKSQ